MLSATVKIWLRKDQSVVRVGVTPAEAAFYVAEHQSNAGKMPVEVIGEPEEIERTNVVEIRRLLGMLSNKKVKALYGSLNANLPETFEDAFELASDAKFEKENLFDKDIAKM